MPHTNTTRHDLEFATKRTDRYVLVLRAISVIVNEHLISENEARALREAFIHRSRRGHDKR